MSDLYQASVLSLSPLDYRRLGELGGTSCADSSGNGRAAGTLHGGATPGFAGLVTPTNNAALKLDGSSGYVSLPAIAGLGSAFTVELWVNLLATGNTTLFCHYDGTNGTVINLVSGSLIFYVATAGGIDNVSSASFPFGSVRHITATYDGTTIRLYMGSTLVAAKAHAHPGAVTDSSTYNLGADNVPGNYSQGIIDEVAIYGTVLTAAQIAANDNAGTGGGVGGLLVTLNPADATASRVSLALPARAPNTPGGLLAGALGVGTPLSHQTLSAFGDSITTGTGASSIAVDYINLLSVSLGVTLDLRAVSGSQVQDQTLIAASYTTTTTTTATVLLGYNDMRNVGLAGVALDNFQGGMTYLLASLLIPSASRIPYNDSSIVYAGSWSQASGGLGNLKSTTATGATATITFTGTTLYFTTAQADTGAGFTVTIDGVPCPGINCLLQQGTALGARYGGAAYRFAGLAPGTHTAVLTYQGSGGTAYVGWYYPLVGTGSLGPRVAVGSVPFCPIGQYASGSDLAVRAYNVRLLTTCLAFARDGHLVSFADIRLRGDTDYVASGIHPNNQGHYLIFAAFMRAIMADHPAGGRVPDVGDVLGDSVGLVVGSGTATILRPLPTTIGGVGPYPLNHDGGAGLSGAPVTVGGVAGSADCLRIVDVNGAGISGAIIRLYLAGDATLSTVQAAATTGPDGRWLAPIYCASGSYQLVMSADGDQADVQSVVVP